LSCFLTATAGATKNLRASRDSFIRPDTRNLGNKVDDADP
jgi:hypothetical protein